VTAIGACEQYSAQLVVPNCCKVTTDGASYIVIDRICDIF